MARRTDCVSCFHWKECWQDAGCPRVKVASIGLGTTKALEPFRKISNRLSIDFSPSVANGETLAKELPDAPPRVVYPSSRLASNALEDGLKARGFSVERMNTYSTR